MTRSKDVHPNPLASARVLVVGGTSGVGYAVASAVLANGGSVHVTSSSQSKITSTVSDLRKLYPTSSVSGSAADLSNASNQESNLHAVLDASIKALGDPLDHIVYTAGESFVPTPLTGITAANAFDPWNVRYLGPLLLAKLVAANPGIYLADSRGSSITLTSGIPTRRPRLGITSVVGIVGALETVTRALSMDLAPMRVNVIVLGSVRTELTERYGHEMLETWSQKTLGKAIGTPEEAAEAYLFSMRSWFVTGQDIVVDGGAVYL